MTRRWFFQATSAVAGLFGIKPAVAKPAPPAVKPKPMVTFTQSVGQPGYVFTSLYLDVEWNAELKMVVGRDGMYPLTTSWITGPSPDNHSRRHWLGFSSVVGLLADQPVTITLTSNKSFVVHHVVPTYRLPAHGSKVPVGHPFRAMYNEPFERQAKAAREEIAKSRRERAMEYFSKHQIKG